MSTLLARAAVSLIAKLITETFLAKLLIEALRAWAKQTDNKYDDRVVEAAAQALGIDPVVVKELAQ